MVASRAPARGALLALAVVSLAAVGVPGAGGDPAQAALECNGTIILVQSLGTSVYFDRRDSNTVWVYREVNSLPGLQSGGALLFISDPCRNPLVDTPDQLIGVLGTNF